MANVYKGQIFYTDCSTYYKFLKFFGEEHSFQTFDDKGKNRKLIKQFHGTIKEHFHALAELNKQGAGVFFTVNQTDLLGRSSKNIIKVRAVFIDLDGAPLPKSFESQPHLIINTSPNKYHCYWLVSDMPIKSFELYQKALATKYNSDMVIHDKTRLMRVAGFFHCKNNKYPIKILHQQQNPPYSRQEIKEKLSLSRPKQNKISYEPKTYDKNYTTNFQYGATKGDRHEKLIKMLVSMRKRGEDYEYARNEVVKFAQACNPPENMREVIFQLNDIWRRYAST